MNTINTLLIIGILVESLIQYGDQILNKGNIAWKQIIAILLGILVAVAARIDLFATVGIPLFVPYLGYALTGILLSRGSNYIADLLSLIQKAIPNTTTTASVVVSGFAPTNDDTTPQG
jgi:hypothetical protein